MKELIGRVRNRCWIAVLVLVFVFLCCGNMKVYAASCNNHVRGDIEFVWNENHREANGDNRNLIAMSIPELEAFVDEVIPAEKIVRFREDLLDIEIDVSEYLPAV